MLDTEDGALTFATDRLAHALLQPIRFGRTDWGERALRALSNLQQALARHATLAEAATGVLGRIGDRSLLPLTPACRSAARLREQHATLRRAAKLLEQELAGVVGFSESLAPLEGPGQDFHEQCQAGAFRALIAVARQGQQLLEAVRAHRAAEDELRRLGDEQPTAVGRSRHGGSARWN
jgi:hypothetical protein